LSPLWRPDEPSGRPRRDDDVSTDLVSRFAQLVAAPGTRATYIDSENKKAGSDSPEAASRSGRAFFVVVRDTILAIDCDRADLVAVLEGIKAQLIADGLVPLVDQSGGEGRRHLFCLILDPRTMRAYREHVNRLGHRPHLEVRPFIRPPLSPHRRGLPVALLDPEDPAEALAALTPTRPKDLSPEWMEFLHHGAPVGQRSTKIQGCALAAVNAGWTFGDYYWAMVDPANRGGEKIQGRRDAERYLERAWENAVARAKRNPPVQDRSEAIALIARMQRRVETWPWPKRAGETYRRVFGAYVTIAERTGKLVFAAGVREVADLAGVSVRAVVDAKKWLQREGWLRRQRAINGAPPTPNSGACSSHPALSEPSSNLGAMLSLVSVVCPPLLTGSPEAIMIERGVWRVLRESPRRPRVLRESPMIYGDLAG
jgi:hypothetical protein